MTSTVRPFTRLTMLIKRHLHARSIRAQLALGLAFGLVPCLALGFYVTQQYTKSRVLTLTENRLQAEAELISFGLSQWGRGVSRLVHTIAVTPSFRTGRIAEIQTVLDRVASEDSDRLWRFWSASSQPKLLASAGGIISSEMKRSAEKHQFTRSYYQAALRGASTYQTVISRTTGKPCLNVAQPVFTEASFTRVKFQETGRAMAAERLMRQPIRTDLSGVLVLCIPLEQIGFDTGLVDLFKDEKIPTLNGNNSHDFLHNPKGFNSAIVLVSNSGQLLFPDVRNQKSSIPLIADLKSSSLTGLYEFAHQSMSGREGFVTLSANDQRYFAFSSKVDSAWSLILLLNDRAVTGSVNAIARVQAFVGLVTLLLALFIVVLRSRSLSRPLSIAGSALKRISTGDFDVLMPPARDDEIGGLLTNVQITANRLKSYLNEVTSFAVTQKQIDTAKSIQKDFLLARLPVSPDYDVAAFSRPALEIGADWYDMVDLGDYVIFLVADVCDKGVPSALYMSVFRSLIRSKLIEHSFDSSDSVSPANVMRAAIEQTNNYMAANQNESMMFATVFVAVVNKLTGVAEYICAGHESPVLIGDGSVQSLDQVSGPAIGLFEGASYQPSRLQLNRGDALVIYSDGLVDARSPDDVGWGHERLLEVLPRLSYEKSEQLLESVVSVVDEYMDGSDQFDDLTVMVFRWTGH